MYYCCTMHESDKFKNDRWFFFKAAEPAVIFSFLTEGMQLITHSSFFIDILNELKYLQISEIKDFVYGYSEKNSITGFTIEDL